MKQKILILFALFSIVSIMKAQNTEFWYVAPQTSNGSAFLILTNGSDKTANVTITMWNGSTTPSVVKTITIAPDGYHRENGYVYNPIGNAGTITNYGIHIVSDQPIKGYHVPIYSEMFVFKGEDALGKNFYVSYQHDNYYVEMQPTYRTQANIIATEDNTDITFTPTANCVNTGGTAYQAGTTYTITGLNRGQTFMLVGTASPSLIAGTHITSTKPIAVTVSNMAISGDGNAADPAGDQIVPVDKLGQEYVAIKGFMYREPHYGSLARENDRVYFTGTENGTTITVYYEMAGTPQTQTLAVNAGETTVFHMGTNTYSGGVITAVDPEVIYAKSDKPVYCFHHSGVGREPGASILPSMSAIGQQKISFFLFGATDGFSNNYGFLIFRENTENSFTIEYDGNKYPLSVTANPIPNMSEWVWGKVEFPPEAEDKPIIIQNNASNFSLGYFGYMRNGFANYGYLTAFGYFSFPYDVVYKCADETTTLDGGYANNYKWEYSATSDSGPFEVLSETGSSLIASKEGYYKLTMNQNPEIISDIVCVRNIDIQEDIQYATTYSGSYTTTYSASVNPILTSDPNLNISYNWTFTGGTPATSTEASPTVVWTGDELTATLSITVESVTANSTGSCNTTLYMYLMADQDVCAGLAKTIDASSFTLPGGSTPTSYQWQSSKNGATWADITENGTSSSYATSSQKQGVTYYRVLMDGTASEPAKIRLRSCLLPVNHNISVMGYYD